MYKLITYKLNHGINIDPKAVHFDMRTFHFGKRFRLEYYTDGYNELLQKRVQETHTFEAIQARVFAPRRKEYSFVFKCYDGRKLSVACAELIAKIAMKKKQKVWVVHQEFHSPMFIGEPNSDKRDG